MAKKKSNKKRTKKIKRTYNTSGLVRYRAITSAIRSSYKEQGKEYDRQSIREEYHNAKEKLKDVPLKQIQTAIDSILTPLVIPKKGVPERGELPQGLEGFAWFELDKVFDRGGSYFKPDDKIRIDMSAVNKPDIEFEFKDYEKVYHETYNSHWRTKDDGDIDKQDFGSSVPEIQFMEQEQDGTFVFSLNGQKRGDHPTLKPLEGEKAKSELKKPEPSTITPTGNRSEKELDLEIEKEKTKQKASEAQTETAKAQKAKSIENITNLYVNGKITDEQYNTILKALG